MTPDEAAALGAEARAVEGEVVTAAEQVAADETAEQAGPSSAEMIATVAKVGFGIFCPAWEVTDAECAALGEGVGPAVDKWLPNLDLGVELTALLTVAMVLGPRWGKPRKAEEPRQDDKALSDTAR